LSDNLNKYSHGFHGGNETANKFFKLISIGIARRCVSKLLENAF